MPGAGGRNGIMQTTGEWEEDMPSMARTPWEGTILLAYPPDVVLGEGLCLPVSYGLGA